MNRLNQPRVQSAEPREIRPIQSPARGGPAGSLYIADDNLEFAEFVARVAEREGWDTTLCKNGIELIAKLEARMAPTIVFVDLMMPEMDGIEAIKRLAKMKNRIRVRFVTGGAVTNVDAAEKIANGYGISIGPTLFKPFTMDELKVELLKELVGLEKLKMEHCKTQ